MLKRTPLYEEHQKLGAKLVEFGGWEMPVQYTSIVDEHLNVRRAAGIFDISHMGEVFVSGPASSEFLNFLLTNDVTRLAPGQGQYTLMCAESGGVIDDLYLYCLGLGNYLLIVNASRIEADYQWIQEQHRKFPRNQGVFTENKSDSYGAVAVQGPAVPRFIDACLRRNDTETKASALVKNEILQLSFDGEPIQVARTGYTGEEGFEIVAPSSIIKNIWLNCLEAGKDFGIQPAGLGARDTLRTEMCYPLYGHELDLNTTPIEAGLSYFVALTKGEFLGVAPITGQKSNGPSKKLTAFKTTGKSPPPRPGYAIFSGSGEESRAGLVTSGTQSPSLNAGIGLGYVPPALAKPGTELQIEIRGKKFQAVVVKKPFYNKTA
jgi:aminomethyltransferase